MQNSRLYAGYAAIEHRIKLGKDESEDFAYKKRFIFAFGGKTQGQSVSHKIIEKYDIEQDKWTQVKCQVNDNNMFARTHVFLNRYIYCFSVTLSGYVEILDTYSADTDLKCTKLFFDDNHGCMMSSVIIALDDAE